MESEQLKISQKFEHNSAPNIRIRSAQPRIGNFNRSGAQNFQKALSHFSSKPGLTMSNPQSVGSRTRGISNEIARFSRPTNTDKIASIINKQEQFKREHQMKENIPANYVKNFFDM